MPADQAAGLRRRGAQRPVRCIHGFFESAESSTRLARALHQLGQVSLLVDMHGRWFADAPARSLFDWKQQLQRGQLHILPLAYGAGWVAPGVRGDEPALRGVARGYDQLVFDAGPTATDLALMPGAVHVMIVEIQPAQDSMRSAYALLKTLAHTREAFCVGLLGDRVACDHVQSACSHFLERRFAQSVYSAAHEDDAFAVLAARMTGEETGLTARYTTESTGNMALKHGW